MLPLLVVCLHCTAGKVTRHSRPQIKMDVVDWDARIFTVPDFVSDAEAEVLIEAGHSVLNRQHGEAWKSRHAYSNVFYEDEDYAAHPVLKVLEDRIARLTMVKNHANEPSMMFTRQIPGVSPGASMPSQAFRNVHHDKNQRENRVVTVLVYLSNARADDGGHTLFPCLPNRRAGGLVAASREQERIAAALAGRFRELFNNGTRIIQAENIDTLPLEDVAVLQECNRQVRSGDHIRVLTVGHTHLLASHRIRHDRIHDCLCLFCPVSYGWRLRSPVCPAKEGDGASDMACSG